ncbi:MAG: response regulator transcription factor [Deltaproteobacteria bacterium]|nr:response regulator transcription factor [Deltaproteobacteria bacterium]
MASEGKKILIIDDEPDFTELAATMLGFHGFQMTAVNDPLRVENTIDQHPFDLIVTDLMMPGLDGFKLIKKIRSRVSYQQTPLIVLTAKIISDEERKFLLNHQVQVVSKPFHPHQLVEQIRKLLV